MVRVGKRTRSAWGRGVQKGKECLKVPLYIDEEKCVEKGAVQRERTKKKKKKGNRKKKSKIANKEKVHPLPTTSIL